MAKCLLLQNSDIDCRDVQAPKKIELDKPKIVLGKGSPKLSVDVVLSALKCEKEIISRRHAEIIVLDNGDCIINDLGALNGIFVNNVKVNSQKLSDGDMIQFGGICNQTVGTLLDKSDVSLRYMFRSYNNTSDAKRKSPDNSLQSNGGKRSKAVLDSLHNIVSPPLANNKSPGSDTENEKTALSKLQAELKVAQTNFGVQIERLKQEHLAAEAPLMKEIFTLKAQSAVQIEAIENRDGVVKATKTLCKQLEDRIRSLQEQIAAAERKLTDKSEQCKTLQVSLEAATAREKSASVQAAQCGVSSNTLMSSLSCPLCEEMLVEAVVLQCSHGFCRACIEQHWHTTAGTKTNYRPTSTSTSSSSGAAANVTCKCPRCNATSSARAHNRKASPRAGQYAYYVRSDHLDSLTWLLVEAGSAAERQKYETREAQHRKSLQALGIDPDLVPSNDPCDDDETDTFRGNKKPSAEKVHQRSSAEKPAFCDYCGGSGHAEEECPHRMDDGAVSSSEEEESGGEINSDDDDM